MTGVRSPLCASLVAQTNPTRLSHCDPGPGVGYRIAFYGDDGSWDQVETSFPVMTHDEARTLIASANRAVSSIGRIAA
jgi:hypothetical protein